MRDQWRPAAMIATAAALMLLTGCASGPRGLQRSTADDFALNVSGRTGAAVGADRLAVDLLFLETLTEEMQAVMLQAAAIAQRMAGRDGYTQEDMDRFAHLLFRFQLCRAGFWEISDHYNRAGPHFGRGGTRLKAELIGIRTAMQITYYDSLFLLTFHDDNLARGALNRAYPQASMEAGVYNAILETALDPANLDARDAVWHFLVQERTPSGRIGKVAARDAEVHALAESIQRYHTFGEATLDRLLGRRGIVFPVLENRLRQSLAAGVLKTAGETGMRGLSAAGHFSLSLLRPLAHSPLAQPTRFSDDQIDLMQMLIQPGDILLTYTSGYLTSLFFPGVFKHGIVYAGTDLQRDTLRLERRWRYSTRRNNLIEAVGQGVIWNNLGNVVDAKVSLIAVLRPLLGQDDRRAYLQAVYDYLGHPYDLRFDFMCDKRLCCTEVIYHALNGRGRVRFPMVSRFGMPTLSADDILEYYLTQPGEAFDLVLLGEPDATKAGKHGVVHVGPEALSRLRAVLHH